MQPPRKLLGLGLAAAIPGALALYSAHLKRSAERAVPPDGRIVEVNGARLHYVDRGAGPAIVMVHGLGGQVRNFSYALLDRLAADHRVILVDRPGSGYSVAAPGGQAGIAGQATLVAGLIRKLNLRRPLVVGHSLGGAVALALALDHPEAVGGLALLAPLTQPLEEVPPMFAALARTPAAVRLPFAWTIGAPMAKLTAPATLAQIFAPDPVPDDFGTRGGGLLAARPGNIDAAGFDLSAATPDLRAMIGRYPSLALPVAILFGRDDQVLDLAINGERTVAAIPGATLAMTGGGHMIPITAPDDCVAVIRGVTKSGRG